jgi:hypothetical protein
MLGGLEGLPVMEDGLVPQKLLDKSLLIFENVRHTFEWRERMSAEWLLLHDNEEFLITSPIILTRIRKRQRWPRSGDSSA